MGRFVSRVVVDANGTPLANAIGQIFDISDTTNSTPLAIMDVGGTPLPLDRLVANNDGITPEFTVAGHPRVKWVSGAYQCDMLAWDTIPVGGLAGQVLSKTTSADFDLGWTVPPGLPLGGVDGQVLTKSGSGNYETRWGAGGAGSGGGSVQWVKQNPDGTWPARPTDSAAVMVLWIGWSNWPAITTTGTVGMRDNTDARIVRPAP